MGLRLFKPNSKGGKKVEGKQNEERIDNGGSNLSYVVFLLYGSLLLG
jgi:hypothetical protein